MTTHDLIALMKKRGVNVVLGEDGAPRLTGRVSEVTPAIKKVLKFHRQRIIDSLQTQLPSECRWANGFVGRHWFTDQGFPTGAGWWRKLGDAEWQPIPGRVNAAGQYEYRGPYVTEAARKLWGAAS